MVHAIIMNESGPPDVLKWVETDVNPPGPGEIQLQQSFAGLNFADVRMRQTLRSTPTILGLDGAGKITAIGAGATGFAVGDRIVYTLALGGYTEARNIPAHRAVRVPDDIDDATAIALIGKGLTTRYLLKDLRTVHAGETILVHSAAGGCGSLLSQWASSLGVRVIGTVSTAAKVDYARRNGCAEVIVRSAEDIAKRVAEITAGAKVSIVYDSVGKDTFIASLDSLKPRGLMVSYGATSGPVPDFNISEIGRRGAIMLVNPGLPSFIGTEAELANASQDLWQAVREGRIRPNIERRLPLREAAAGHRAMETGDSLGAVIFEI